MLAVVERAATQPMCSNNNIPLIPEHITGHVPEYPTTRNSLALGIHPSTPSSPECPLFDASSPTPPLRGRSPPNRLLVITPEPTRRRTHHPKPEPRSLNTRPTAFAISENVAMPLSPPTKPDSLRRCRGVKPPFSCGQKRSCPRGPQVVVRSSKPGDHHPASGSKMRFPFLAGGPSRSPRDHRSGPGGPPFKPNEPPLGKPDRPESNRVFFNRPAA